MASLKAELEGRIDLLYVDPPYGTGKKKHGMVRGTATTGRQGSDDEASAVAYEDPPADDPRYLDRLWTFFRLVAPLLSDRGQVFVHLDQRASALVRLILDEVFGRRSFLNEIIWHYSSGGRATKFYARKSDSILWYAPRSGYRFYPERLARPRNRCWKCGSIVEDRNHMKRHRDDDGRVYRSIRSGGKTYRYYDDDPVAPSNVWLDIGHIQQRDPERMGYPTQKPEALLERILLGHSDEDDLVADFFCGSGTTLAVAHRLGRSWIGCDASRDAVEVSAARLEVQIGRFGGAMVVERTVPSQGRK
ncbi:MAG: site-specific DNA-methyltransferase [Deltaproteobacteria bacterium]|nr:site-specific DNA-methyltransferase [Deltaproteobacteria bacterium]